MYQLIQDLKRLERILGQATPNIGNRLQPGISSAEIEKRTASFSWQFPQDAFALYQRHNGLSGRPNKLNLAERFVRIKGKWHGELAGRENEVHIQIGYSLVVAKFLPLDYALAGHRHLKLGRCPLNLLPFAIWSDHKTTTYCMMRLDPEKPTIYCADGTKRPPSKVTDSFLSTQPQFSQLSELIEFLSSCFNEGIKPITASKEESKDPPDCHLDLATVSQHYQQRKSNPSNLTS